MNREIGLRIQDRSVVDPETLCWNWNSVKDKDGYGKMKVKGKWKRTHRLAYEHYIKPIPEGLGVLHSCDNPSCNNPAHLSVGTVADNMRHKAERQRIVGAKHPHSKLTDEDVLAIRESILSQSKLAEQYVVIQAHISRIKRRVNWTHI